MAITEAKKAIQRRSYLKHRDERLAARRAYRAAHLDEERAAGRRYYAEHREAILIKHQRPAVRERRQEAHARFIEKNPTAVRDWKREHRAEMSEAARTYYQRRGKFLIRMRHAEQANACAVCGLQFGEGKTLAPHVDHDHESGRVRSLLCINCNFLVGYCREDESVLIAAAAYLRQQKGN